MMVRDGAERRLATMLLLQLPGNSYDWLKAAGNSLESRICVYLWWGAFLDVLIYSCSILCKTSIEQPSASSLESLSNLFLQTSFSHFCTEQLAMQEKV
jgi:hypothetical protein